jgi:hypothetical protein
MSDTAGVQFLRVRRKAQEGVDLAVDEKLLRRYLAAADPADVLGRVDADICGDDRQEQMRRRTQERNADALALEVGNASKSPCTNNSKHPTCRPVSTFIGTPRSIIAIITGE